MLPHSMAVVRKRNPFGCLGTTIPDEVPRPQFDSSERRRSVNTDRSYSRMKNEDEKKSIPPPLDTTLSSFPFPSLSTASRELLHPNPPIFTSDSRDYHFVFRSEPYKEECPFRPYKVLLFIASAEGYQHSNIANAARIEDPRLSENGVAAAKNVSARLRKAKQLTPDIMFSSSMYRALSTMQLVCPEWYDDVKSVALDELRPQTGDCSSSKRSDPAVLASDFRKVAFDNISRRGDPLWNDEAPESEENVLDRIHLFVSKYLVPPEELVRTQYGTARPDRLCNVGFRSSSPSVKGFASRSPTPCNGPPSDCAPSHQKRVVVVSHRRVLSLLLSKVVDDVSPALCQQWKHGDIRKVFVYTKQQLGMAPVPHLLSRMKLRQNRSQRNLRKSAARRAPERRSKTPTAPGPVRQKSRSVGSLASFGNVAIATTSGESNCGILMTSTDRFESHRFTLTSMSAALTVQRNSLGVHDHEQYLPALSIQRSQSERPPKVKRPGGGRAASHRRAATKENLTPNENHKIVITPPAAKKRERRSNRVRDHRPRGSG